MQFLTLNHPVDCGICDKSGECLLQDYHFQHNGEKSLSNEPKVNRSKYYEINERILLDNERCILCSRCVRFTQEISKTNLLGIVKRGDHAIVRKCQEEKSISDPYSDNLIDICPVGALLSKKILYSERTWFLKKTRSICPGCDRGCNIEIWSRKENWNYAHLTHKNNTIARVTPFINPDVNGHWICNKGRDLKDIFERPRISSAAKNEKRLSIEKAITEIKKLITTSNRTAFIISSWGSNEELETLKLKLKSFPNIETYVKDDFLPDNKEIIEDHILIRKNKNPNRSKAVELFGSKDFPRGQPFELVLIWGEGFDYYNLIPETKIVQFSSYPDAITPYAHIIIPLTNMLEHSGHFTNGLGITNHFEKVFPPSEEIIDAQKLFLEIFKEENYVG